jgi:hypothetical protein
MPAGQNVPVSKPHVHTVPYGSCFAHSGSTRPARSPAARRRAEAAGAGARRPGRLRHFAAAALLGEMLDGWERVASTKSRARGRRGDARARLRLFAIAVAGDRLLRMDRRDWSRREPAVAAPPAPRQPPDGLHALAVQRLHPQRRGRSVAACRCSSATTSPPPTTARNHDDVLELIMERLRRDGQARRVRWGRGHGAGGAHGRERACAAGVDANAYQPRRRGCRRPRIAQCLAVLRQAWTKQQVALVRPTRRSSGRPDPHATAHDRAAARTGQRSRSRSLPTPGCGQS